ncbi:hypothetical protein 1 [Wuhan coneheads virus 2]|uniref:hypothetical protein 1 n=1 Tax=Wuhan coneheads virus 2 TaxID=1923696 RepID=UPI00090B727A|nr:hypothetical protein 1 [Wuhan coneheads virus 2]APG78426.1 hypothetical protein 1 [Wuhan coneheads virus 2]APG78614.1 hypothetical protein 1 [Wuhan coneheads virus 2]
MVSRCKGYHTREVVAEKRITPFIVDLLVSFLLDLFVLAFIAFSDFCVSYVVIVSTLMQKWTFSPDFSYQLKQIQRHLPKVSTRGKLAFREPKTKPEKPTYVSHKEFSSQAGTPTHFLTTWLMNLGMPVIHVTTIVSNLLALVAYKKEGKNKRVWFSLFTNLATSIVYFLAYILEKTNAITDDEKTKLVEEITTSVSTIFESGETSGVNAGIEEVHPVIEQQTSENVLPQIKLACVNPTGNESAEPFPTYESMAKLTILPEKLVFDGPQNIVHCIAADNCQGAGFALALREKYPENKEALKTVDRNLGDCICVSLENHEDPAQIYNLITKPVSRIPPDETGYQYLEKALKALPPGVYSMPFIGTGLDKMNPIRIIDLLLNSTHPEACFVIYGNQLNVSQFWSMQNFTCTIYGTKECVYTQKNMTQQIDIGNVATWFSEQKLYQIGKMCQRLATKLYIFMIIKLIGHVFTGFQNFNLDTIHRDLTTAKGLRENVNVILEEVLPSLGVSTPFSDRAAAIQQRMDELGSYMEMNANEFMESPILFNRYKEELARCSKVVNTWPVPFRQEITVLTGLLAKANQRYYQLKQSIDSFGERPMPVTYIFTGTKGIGKSELTKQLARTAAKIINPDRPVKENIVQIGNEKYWPQLAGEQVVIFDDIMSTNLEPERFCGSIKHICNTTRFVADAADVEHKCQNFAPRVILASTNTTVAEMVEFFLLSGNLQSSMEAIFSRFKVIQCTRNVTEYGPVTGDRMELVIDETGNFRHLCMKEWVYSAATNKLVPGRNVLFNGLVSELRQDMARNYMKFQESLRAYETQAGSVDHHVIHLSGDIRQGKSFLIENNLLPHLEETVGLPVLRMTEEMLKSDKIYPRSIVIIDDLILEEDGRLPLEKEYIKFYNNRLGTHSIIIFATNVRPKICGLSYETVDIRIPFIPVPVPVPYPVWKYKYPIDNVAILRRAGFKVGIDRAWIDPHNTFIEVKGWKYCHEHLWYGNQQITEIIWKNYGKWAQAHNEYVIRPGNVFLTEQPPIVVRVKTGMFWPGISKIGSYIHHNFASFLASETPWAIYMHEDIVASLVPQYRQFIPLNMDPTHENALEQVKRYGKLLEQLNVDPWILIDIPDVGRYELRSKEIIYEARGDETVCQFDRNGQTITVTLGDFSVSKDIREVFAFIEGRNPIDEFSQINLSSSNLLAKILKLRTMQDFNAEYRAYVEQRIKDERNAQILGYVVKIKQFFCSKRGLMFVAVFSGLMTAFVMGLLVRNKRNEPAPVPVKETVVEEQGHSRHIPTRNKLLFVGQNLGNYGFEVTSQENVNKWLSSRPFVKGYFVPPKADTLTPLLYSHPDWYHSDFQNFWLPSSGKTLVTTNIQLLRFCEKRIMLRGSPEMYYKPIEDWEVSACVDEVQEWSDDFLEVVAQRATYGDSIMKAKEIVVETTQKIDLSKENLRPERPIRPVYIANESGPEQRPKGKKQPIYINNSGPEKPTKKHNTKWYVESGPEKPNKKHVLKWSDRIIQNNLKEVSAVKEPSEEVSAVKEPSKEVEKQNVMTLPPINDFSSTPTFVQRSQQKVFKNLCQVVPSHSSRTSFESDITEFPSWNYGIGIKDDYLITVAHAETAAKLQGANLYVVRDENRRNGKLCFMKLTLVKTFRRRDLALYKVSDMAKCGAVFADITNFFGSIAEMPTSSCTAIWFRYSPEKTLETLHSTAIIKREKTSVKLDSVRQEVEETMWCTYASTIGYVSSSGDCGLPYFCSGGASSGKILGIHCMGNSSQYVTAETVAALIYKEDLQEVLSFETESYIEGKPYGYGADTCQICEMAYNGVQLNNYRKIPDSTCFVSWSSKCTDYFKDLNEASEHLVKFINEEKIERGVIEVNHGASSGGSQPHPHIQLILGAHHLKLYPKNRSKMETYDRGLVMKKLELPSMPEQGMKCVDFVLTNDQFSQLGSWALDVSPKHEFCIRGTYMDGKLYGTLYQTAIADAKIQQVKVNVNQSFIDVSGTEMILEPEIFPCIQQAVLNYKEGMPTDVPFKEEYNVKVVGAFPHSLSKIPQKGFVKTPFSDLVEHLIPNEKAPFNPNSRQAPQEVLDTMIRNNQGYYCARSTQSVQFDHPSPPLEQNLEKHVLTEFKNHVENYYSGLRILNDTQVLQGYSPDHELHGALGPMELDTSAGPTLKMVFGKGKKSDFITRDINGKTYFSSNAEGDF